MPHHMQSTAERFSLSKRLASALFLFTFEILITTNYFDLSLQKSMPSFIVSSPKYHGMNRYRFPRNLPLLSEKYSVLKVLH